jgi:hypothetical protein
VEALDGSIEAVQRRAVPQLAQRVRDFFFDFFLVERSRQRAFFSRRRFLVRLVPPIVEDDDVQRTHARAL